MFLSLHLASASLPSSIFLYRSLPLGGNINQPSKPNPAGWGWTIISLSSGPTRPFRLSLSHFLYLTRILWSLWLVLRRPLCLFLDAPLLPTPTYLFTFPGPPRGANEKVHLLGMGEGNRYSAAGVPDSQILPKGQPFGGEPPGLG